MPNDGVMADPGGRVSQPPLAQSLNHGWISIHVGVTADAEPLLRERVTPLVRCLRERGLIDRYFFIRYWSDGPQVRLRLRPASAADQETVNAEAELALGGFCRQHLPYEREYVRYGGPAGVDLAEWHFEASSDLVLVLLNASTARTTAALLGQSAHLSLTLSRVFLGGNAQVARFLAGYRDQWTTGGGPPAQAALAAGERTFQQTAGRLQRRVEEILSRVTEPARRPAYPPAMRDWLAHCRLLRQRLVELTVSGQVRLPRLPSQPKAAPDASGTETVTDPHLILPAMLGSYLHMAHNRLGLNILGEIYLCHVLQLALLDRAP